MSYPPPPPDQPDAGYPPQMPPQDHPRAMLALILGILGLVVCSVLAPFAWSIGRKAVREIDASGGRIGGRSTAQAGYILGIVGTVLLVLGVIWAIVVAATGSFSYYVDM